MTVPAAATLAVSAAPVASACSLTNHCYSRARDDMGHNNGINGKIYFTCLHSPTSNDFTDNEMWNVTGTGGTYGYYWTEVGVVDGNIQGTVHSRAWFWADFRPGDSQVNEHFPGLTIAGYSTSYPAAITFASNRTWNVYGGNNDVTMGASTGQPNNTIWAAAGSEFTDGQGMRDTGNVNHLVWEDSNGNPHNWGSAGYVDTASLGSNNNTHPSYSSTTSTISWAQC